MKTIHQKIIICACLSAPCAIAQTNTISIPPLAEHPAQLTIKVLDDDNNPVAGIEVAASTFWKHIPGDNFGTDEDKTVTRLTDTNGIATLAFPCLTGEVAFGSRPFAGFYGNVGSQKIRFTDVVADKWQPWNPTEEIHIERILNPIPMYARRLYESKMPLEGKPVGFDLMVGDWVAPYGKGETSDFLFKYESKPEPKVPVREIPPYDVTLTVNFSNDGDGIQSVFVTPMVHSGLRLPRQAPSDGYESVLIKHEYKERGQKAYSNYREDQNYFFRVRTKKDARGNIVSALYGKIYGDFNHAAAGGKLAFIYYLNPKPNDTNMEFDPSKNLFKHLSNKERVNAP